MRIHDCFALVVVLLLLHSGRRHHLRLSSYLTAHRISLVIYSQYIRRQLLALALVALSVVVLVAYFMVELLLKAGGEDAKSPTGHWELVKSVY